ncbi:MAG: lysophospholipid acyltransferase family protein [Odoribacteraceae bacterium]|jgi:KDO2-lipid IV(A) lauroyltransferase|nr:lysophospholipid acyltransferase family protein [Odoribacteraceae bacterium]
MKNKQGEKASPPATSRRSGGAGAAGTCKPRASVLFPFLYALVYTFSLLPAALLYKLSSLLYLFIYHVFSYRKSVVVQNIARSFPDKRYDEIAAITSTFYRSFCDNLIEILKSASISARRQKKNVVLVGGEIVENHIKQGRQVIASMGHCGNWEILNVLPLMLSVNVNTVYKPLSPRCIDRLFLKTRSRFGMKMIPHKSIARHFISHRDNPSMYLFLADQCPKAAAEAYPFDFMHQKTMVFAGIERLACMTGAVVVYLHVVKVSRGKYQIECKEICADPGKSKATEITGEYVRLLERNIEEYPGGWLWSHKRWKR